MRIIFVVLATILGIIIGTGACGDTSRPPNDWLLPPDKPKPNSPPLQFQKGMSYATWTPNSYVTPESDRLLQELKAIGVEWVAIVITWYQDNGSTKIYRDDNETPTDESVQHVIKKAHDLGMRVMLKPTVDLENGDWRGDISFGDDTKKWQAWFTSYKDFTVYYAKLAQEWKVEQFCVGVEYKGTSHRKTDWQNIIREIKAHYSGYLTYAANFDEYQAIQWWDDLDFVGINAYFRLTPKKNPTFEELIAGWEEEAKKIEIWQSGIKKPIVFTEVGYRSIEGAHTKPWDWKHSASLDLAEQADCYKATFVTFWDKPWLAGMYWWLWSPDFEGGNKDKSYTPRGKPASEILRQYYSR